MKVLRVSSANRDYGASYFENEYFGQSVDELIKRVEAGEKFTTGDMEEEDELDMRVLETGDVSPEFIKFMRDEVIDYDDQKHQAFYFEGEIIPS